MRSTPASRLKRNHWAWAKQAWSRSFQAAYEEAHTKYSASSEVESSSGVHRVVSLLVSAAGDCTIRNGCVLSISLTHPVLLRGSRGSDSKTCVRVNPLLATIYPLLSQKNDFERLMRWQRTSWLKRRHETLTHTTTTDSSCGWTSACGLRLLLQ